ncbi:unnamed protein product [Clonostachys rosea f. rosea IK726]|uniref:Uncharacterized protein n=1 Tax=Clonostachys rosea f. rosea IK726 TaxID=1349383 RepID=A0ACA9UIA5_BIOOC|nr:unnamed protein product [Clonostachys rosea f. rosea IK726]
MNMGVAKRILLEIILSSCIVLQQITFLIPVVLLVWHRRSENFLPRNRQFRLPEVIGRGANLWTILSVSVLTVVNFMPPFLPVTGDSMNYSIVVLGILFLVGGINWFLSARKHYQGPRIIFHE